MIPRSNEIIETSEFKNLFKFRPNFRYAVRLFDSFQVLLNLNPGLEGSLIGEVMASGAIGLKSAVGSHLLVVLSGPFGESPVAGNRDLLSAGELELGSSQGFDHVLPVLFLGSDRHQGLSDVDSRHSSERFAERASHTSLEPISAGTTQHLVNAQHVERVDTDSDVERVFAARLHQVLVGADTTRLQSLRRDLLELVGQHMDA